MLSSCQVIPFTKLHYAFQTSEIEFNRIDKYSYIYTIFYHTDKYVRTLIGCVHSEWNLDTLEKKGDKNKRE